MKDKLKKILRPADAVLILALLAAAAAAFFAFSRAQGCTAEVICGGELLYSIDLSEVTESYEIPLDNGAVILVEPGAVSFSRSDCENGLCVRTGKLTKSGQSAACVPNRTVIKITGRAGKMPDALTG